MVSYPREWDKIPPRAFDSYNGSFRGKVAERIADKFLKDAEDVRFMNSKLQDRQLKYSDFIWKGKSIEVRSKMNRIPHFVFNASGSYDFLFLIAFSLSEKKIYKFFVPRDDAGITFSLSKSRKPRWDKYLITTRDQALKRINA